MRAKDEPNEARTELSKALPEDALIDPEKLASLFEKDPAYYEATKLSASLELQLGNPARAVEIYEVAAKAKTNCKLDDGEIYNRLGWAYFKNSEPEQAIKYFEEAIATKENISDATREKAYNNLGQLYFETGRLDESLKVLRESKEKFGSEFATETIKKISEVKKNEALRQQELKESLAK
jgi:tetratricopeptide (TPR) repeat protein